MSDDKDWMLVEFEGTYIIAHPDGLKNQKVTRNFHCKVEMEKSFLEAYSLRGVFQTYYIEEMKKLHPNMIDLYRFRMVEATELDGKMINDPRSMSHENLLQYISDRRYKINSSLYDDQQLRHEVVLYEKDEKGQQHLQARLERIKGATLAVSKRIRERNKPMQLLDADEAPRARTPEVKPAAKPKAAQPALSEIL